MPIDGVERRLAAILSADVVGYTRLMAEDEDATVRRLAYREQITLLVQQHGGDMIDFTGDNSLVEFSKLGRRGSVRARLPIGAEG